MWSWLKFWSKKPKTEIKEEYQKEYKKAQTMREKGQVNFDSEKDKNRHNHTLSISRSGRFRSKRRERGAILDQPDFFEGNVNKQAFKDSTNSKNLPPPPKPPNNTYRDIHPHQNPNQNAYVAEQVVHL